MLALVLQPPVATVSNGKPLLQHIGGGTIEHPKNSSVAFGITGADI